MPTNTYIQPGSGKYGLYHYGTDEGGAPTAIPSRGDSGTLGGSTPGGTSDASTIWNVKNPALEQRLNEYLGEYDANRTKNAADISAFAELFKSYTPDVKAALDQENGALSDVYNGNAKKELDRLSASRNLAVRGVADLALQEARRGASMRGLNGASSGSYTNAQAMANASNIYGKAALDSANQERANYEYLNNLKYGLLGKRASATDAFAQRSLTPYNVRNNNMTNLQGQLGFYNAQDKTNTFYGVGGATGTSTTPPTTQFYFDPTSRGYGL